MTMLDNQTLLIIAAHPDDEVLGCGGLISKIKQTGGKVFVLFITNGTAQDFTIRGISTAKEREEEIEKVAKFLKYDGYKIAFQGEGYHLQLDRLPRKQIIHEIERGEKISLEKVRPNIVTIPYFGDYNQDHATVAQAAFSACRPAPRLNKFVPNFILSYEEPTDFWSLDTHRKLNLFVELTTRQINNKIKALTLYKSQIRGKGHPRSVEVLKSLATIRGSTAGVAFAEGYYCHKLKI